MASRLELQTFFETLTENVYYQPPVNTKMHYPCIRYSRDVTDTIYADDDPYRHYKSYKVIVIDKRPDSSIADSIRNMRMCKQSGVPYVADGLYHEAFILYW